jgi:hypothetical protein
LDYIIYIEPVRVHNLKKNKGGDEDENRRIDCHDSNDSDSHRNRYHGNSRNPANHEITRRSLKGRAYPLPPIKKKEGESQVENKKIILILRVVTAVCITIAATCSVIRYVGTM